jgi:hypothetical protein
MNAGCNGGSNSWSINVLEKSADFFNASRYHHGTLIITLTENGRDVNEGKSRPFDYSIYKDREIDLELFDTVLDDCEDEWIQRLSDVRTELDPRFEIIIGTNFCWHDRLFSALSGTKRGIRLLPNTWIECLSSSIRPPRIRTTNTVWPKTLLQILGIAQDNIYKQWIVNEEPKISRLVDSMAKLPEYFCEHDTGHPNSAGHEIWARQILSVITKEKFARPV